MRRRMKTFMTVIVITMIAVTPSLRALWLTDGTPVSTASDDQRYPAMVSDNFGNTLIVWEDSRNADSDIYVQRLTASGSSMWAADGVAICTATGAQGSPALARAGLDTWVITWTDMRGGGSDIYAQLIDDSGTVQWTTNGVPVCTATGFQGFSSCAKRGNGAIVIWEDQRSGNYDIYAQSLDASGNAEWATDGIPVSAAAGDQYFHDFHYNEIYSEYYVAWRDTRGADSDIYAQKFTSSGSMQWTSGGLAICQATGDQVLPRITSDMDENVYITWQDGRSGNQDIYAQSVQYGMVWWTSDGVAVCTGTGDASYPRIACEYSSEPIIAWQDDRLGALDIYAQRLSSNSGAARWTANGAPVCTAAHDQKKPILVPDGRGGAIITWLDSRNTSDDDIYVQRLDYLGATLWASGGVPVCSTTGGCNNLAIVPDADNGAIIAWDDDRSGSEYDIYANLVDTNGRIGYMPPDINIIQDVPGDQGGWIRLIIRKSRQDDVEETEAPVSQYGAYRRIDDPLLLGRISAEGKQAEADCLPGAIELEGRKYVTAASAGAPPGTWEVVATVPAHQEYYYYCLVPTLADSATVIKETVYCISAETTIPSVYFFSEPDSGYSVDNIAPGVPLGLSVAYNTGSGNELTWNPAPEPDFQYYRIYRGTDEEFVPVPGTEVHSTSSPQWTDPDNHGSGVYYKVTALDYVGNESNPGSAVTTTGTGDPAVPKAFSLGQNVPNPFNPSTTVYYDVPEGGGDVSIIVFDVSGRLVRTLVEGRQTAGAKSVTWNGTNDRGQSVSSGIYFYKMAAPGFARTRKMVLLR